VRPVRATAVAGAALALLVLANGCGSKPALSPTAAHALSEQVAAVRLAAAMQDPVTASSALGQLRATLAQLEQQGQVSATRAGAILSDVAAVQQQLASLPTTTTAAPTTTTITTTAPADHGKGKGDGGGGGGGGD
jgi:hypothetical protein